MANYGGSGGYVSAAAGINITGGVLFIGGYDASTNTPDLDVTPSGILQGNMYVVTAAGLFFTEQVEIGDSLVAKIDDPTVLSDWVVQQANVGFATTSVAGIVELATDGENAANVVVQGNDSRLSDARTPTAHNLGGAEHNADTLANLNLKVSDLIATYGGLRDFGIGTLAQRPAFGTANRFFWTTDELKLYHDTGSAWAAVTSAVLAHAASHTDGTDDIQSAGAAQKGVVDTAAQTFAGLKTFTTPVRLSTLNTGDNVLTTDTDGDVQESGVKVETAPAGGSGFTVVEYAGAPTTPPAGFLWIQAKDGSTKTLSYYDGVNTYSVDLSI